MSKPWICGRQDEPLYVFGIQHPEGFLHPIHYCQHEVWRLFFNQNPSRLPVYEAIKAYEGLGYRRIKFLLNEVPDVSNTTEEVQ